MPPSAEFIKVISDFCSDLETTFPEYHRIIHTHCRVTDKLHAFCVRKYPPRAADFFNKNEAIFEEDSMVDTEFLPHIHFKNLWQTEGLSEQTKDAIWSYLQLITISIGINQEDISTGSESSSSLSPTKEDMDEMVQNALEHMSQIWNREKETSASASESTTSTSSTSTASTTEDPPVPPPDMFEGIFTGKLASIAKELAEETAGSFSFSEDSTLEDATKQIFSNPGNLSSVMKSVSEKLDERMKSGELNQEELMAEAMSMMGKMSSIPGLSNLFNNIPNMAKNPKVQQMSRQEKIKARLRNKVNNKPTQPNKNMK